MTNFTCEMREFLLDAVTKFKTEIGAPVRSPHLAEDFVLAHSRALFMLHGLYADGLRCCFCSRPPVWI
eukprot:708182-Heterocapsa_arctica.AAC.1